MSFKIIGEIVRQETIAYGTAIREIKRLRKFYGYGRWRKRKGIGIIKLESGIVLHAEIHWYEATGFGKFEFKIKKILE